MIWDLGTGQEVLSAVAGSFEACTLWVSGIPAALCDERTLAGILAEKCATR